MTHCWYCGEYEILQASIRGALAPAADSQSRLSSNVRADTLRTQAFSCGRPVEHNLLILLVQLGGLEPPTS